MTTGLDLSKLWQERCLVSPVDASALEMPLLERIALFRIKALGGNALDLADELHADLQDFSTDNLFRAAFAFVFLGDSENAAAVVERLRAADSRKYCLIGVEDSTTGKRSLDVHIPDGGVDHRLLLLEAVLLKHFEAGNAFDDMKIRAFLKRSATSAIDVYTRTAEYYLAMLDSDTDQFRRLLQHPCSYDPVDCVLMPTERELALRLSQLLCSRGLYGEALPLLEPLRLPVQHAQCLLQLGRKPEAVELLRSTSPPSGDCLCLLGQMTEELAVVERAWTDFSYRPALLILARKDVLDGRYGDAVPRYESFLKGDPHNVDVLCQLGHCQMRSFASLEHRKAALERAVKTFKRCTVLEPASVVAWTNMGACLYELERPAEALTAFKEAVKLDYQNKRLWANVLQAAIAADSATDVAAASEILGAGKEARLSNEH